MVKFSKKLELIAGVYLINGVLTATSMKAFVRNKKASKEISQKSGLDIGYIKNIKFENTIDEFKIILNCIRKRSQKFINLEYLIAQSDYIKINDRNTNKFDFLRKIIIPNYKIKILSNDRKFVSNMTI